MPVLIKNTTLSKIKLLDFNIVESGWYLFSITARVKDKKQRDSTATDDEDLVIKLDSQEFPSLSNQHRLIDSPAAFSGGNQHNSDKTVYILQWLTAGTHILELAPQYEAYIINVSYERIDPISNKFGLDLNLQASDRDRAPWITFVVADLPIKEISVEATTKWRLFDGDDVQIKINGDILVNKTSLFHKNWIFSAVPVLDLFAGRKKGNFPVESARNVDYIEFFADRKPVLNRVEFVFRDIYTKTDIRKYVDTLYGRDYNRFDRYINGAVQYWNGFFSERDFPPAETLDPSLVKAIIYRESKLGYDTNNNGQIDVMQVWGDFDPAKPTILGDFRYPGNELITATEYGHIKFSFPGDRIPPRVTTPEESIFWGVRWLYHKAQGFAGEGANELNPPFIRTWLSWRDAVYGYNASAAVEEYVTEVFSIYLRGIDSKGNILWES